MTSGYYRFPTISGETIVFVSEDDLWSVSVNGGVARRLTSNLGEVTYPMLSPDGAHLAFVGREEGGPEVYVMPAEGGSARRLTYLSNNCRIVGWTADSTGILFASSYGQPVAGEMALFRVDINTISGHIESLPYGPARSIAFGPGGAVVIGRNTGDPARWKRYRGGTAGHLWIDRNGDGQFERLLEDVAGNIASPMWINGETGGRIFLVSDHEGIGNLYSCLPDGTDLQRHTDHEDYYVRNPSSDGSHIVYHVGADLCLYVPETDEVKRIDVDYRSPRVQRNRKFVDAGRYMDSFALHPSGRALAVTTRGKTFAFSNHEGPVLRYGKQDGVRYRLAQWLHDGRRIVMVTDEPGEETLEVYDTGTVGEPKRLEDLDLGRILSLQVSPVADLAALANHRHELLIVDLTSGRVLHADRSEFRHVEGFDWSPDGRWLAYSLAATSRTSEIRLFRLPDEHPWGDIPQTDGSAEVERGVEAQAIASSAGMSGHERAPDGSVISVTRPVLHDVRPTFDPEGKYLYFLSYREFNPVYDSLHFDLGFPWGMRPYLIPLRADMDNPFVPKPHLGVEGFGGEDENESDEDDADRYGSEYDDQEQESGEEEQEDDDLDDYDDDDDDDDFEEDEEEEDDDGWITSGQNLAAARLRRGLTRAAVSRPTRRMRRISTEDPEANGAKAKGDTSSTQRREDGNDRSDRKDGKTDEGKRRPKPIRIDLDGIERRIVAFPVPDARYGQIVGIQGKALFTSYPVHGQLDGDDTWEDETESGTLRAYDFKDFKTETLAEHVSWFQVSANQKKLVYSGEGRLRVIDAGEKAPSSNGPPRKTGWIELGRVKVPVDPQSEWEQMFREAWRLQRDHFWTEDMAQVDWRTVYDRYFPLIARVSTRSEFSDLMWEMQGELGTSHAYEIGGDYRSRPYYGQGFLGAELTWDADSGGYRIGDIIVGDPWDPDANSPLASPGVDVRTGDIILAINGQGVDVTVSPAQMLVNQAGNEVLLTLARREDQDGNGKTEVTAREGAAEDEPEQVDSSSNEPSMAEPIADESPETEPRGQRTVIVRAIASEAPARYRRWVEANRRHVHASTDGRVGYVHVPDMGPQGYAEFHRGYLAEVDREALIVDVRYNGGGHVSQLILEKLARRRIGYDLSRWGGLIPYPVDSVAGPLVALTNEHAGSDGDIFCHSFKLMKLGPLIGKRTWGGVIGISPSHALVDGTVTTQPEYSFWFEDVGWNVENYGTEPDIEVDVTPQDYATGHDPQLARAIAEAVRLLHDQPVQAPQLEPRPSRALPKLPPRTR